MIVSEYNQFKEEGEFEAMGGLDAVMKEYEDRIAELEHGMNVIADLIREDMEEVFKLEAIQEVADKLKPKGDDESE